MICRADVVRRFPSLGESPTFRAGLRIFAMPRRTNFRVVGRPGLRGWLIILVAVSMIVAIAVAIAVVAIGVFLFLLPLLIVAAALYYVFWRTKLRRRYW